MSVIFNPKGKYLIFAGMSSGALTPPSFINHLNNVAKKQTFQL